MNIPFLKIPPAPGIHDDLPELLLTKDHQLGEHKTSLAGAMTNGARSGISSLWNKAKNVGQSLKNPETYKAVAHSLTKVDTYRDMAIGGLLMKATKVGVGSAVALSAAPVWAQLAIVTASAGAIGGLLKSNKQYKAAKAAFEMDEANEGQEFQGRFSYLRENKMQFLKNAFVSAAFGTIGAGIVEGLHHVSPPSWMSWDHASSVTSAEQDAGLEITDADKIPLAPEPEVIAAPKTALDQAIALLEAKGELTDQMKNSIEFAKNGHQWAIKDIAYYINTDGIASNDHLVSGILDQANGHVPTHIEVPAAPVAHVIEPTLNLEDTIKNLPLEETVDAPAVAPEDTLSTGEKVVIGAGSTIVGGGLAALGVDHVAKNALGEPTAPARLRERAPIEEVIEARPPFMIANTCRVTDVPNQPKMFNVVCPHTPAVADMRPGDALRVEYTNDANMTVSEVVALGGNETVSTKSYEESLFNSDHFSGGILARLKGAMASIFNRSSATAEISVPAAQNDNSQPETSGVAPVVMAAAPN